MGLQDSDVVDDGDGGGKASPISCSICLEAVADTGDRSWAKLQCGHEFHLDCIGSAFNIKGAMQCPNCRKIEKGQWLYASGCRPFPEFSMDDWVHDEDIYDLSYSEMSFGVHWCPFSGLTRLPSSFDEGEFSSSTYHDLLGHHAVFAEHTAVSSATHPCPYIAYFGPVHPSSANTNGNVSDGSSFNSHWNGPSVPSEMSTSYSFPAMDVRYHNWEPHSTPFPASSNRVGGADQALVPPLTHRAARSSSEMPRSGSFMHPFLVGHSSARAGSSIASSMVPPYPGSVARTRGRVQALQAYFQQPSNTPAIRTPMVPATRRSSTHRGVAQVGPVASSSDQTAGLYYYPSASSGRNFQEAENPVPNRFHAWEREHLNPFSMNQMDRDPIWGTFHQAAGGSETAMRSSTSFRQRHGGSERTPSLNRS